MDLRNVDDLKTSWVLDEGTGDMTLSFTNNDGDVALGDIQIESSRLRSFFTMLLNSGTRHFLPNNENDEEHKSVFDSRAGETNTEFFEE